MGFHLEDSSLATERLDFEDSWLATTAAIGIAQEIEGRKNSYKGEIKKLSNKLLEISKKTIYAPTSTILATLYWPDKEDWKGRKNEEVNFQTYILAENLSRLEGLTKDKQIELKNACILLSNLISRTYYSFGLRLSA